MKDNVLPILIQFLCSSPTHNNDLKYWSLLLVHQFSLAGILLKNLCQSAFFIITEDLHEDMIEANLIPLLAKMTRLTFGNTNMQKLCLHSLVRLVSSIESTEGVKQVNIIYYIQVLF